jgi:hypothetical protein
MTNHFESIDIHSLDNVTGGEGAGPAETAGEQYGSKIGTGVGAWLGGRLGFPATGGVVGDFVGGGAGRLIGRGIDYVNSHPDVRQAAEQAPQGA